MLRSGLSDRSAWVDQSFMEDWIVLDDVSLRWFLATRSLFPVDFQQNTLPGAVATEFDDLVDLLAIQALQRVVQSSLGTDSWMRHQWIIDMCGPALFLKCIEHLLLVFSRPLESRDNNLSDTKFPSFSIPARHWVRLHVWVVGISSFLH